MTDEIGFDSAVKCAQRLRDLAQKDGKPPLSLAIVDPHGDLVYFMRMKGAPPRTVNVAINKAYTAARWGRDTGALKKRLLEKNDDLRWFGDERYTALPGGMIVKHGERMIGAIGISGRTSEEDAEMGGLIVRELQ